jgi:hypothetical protein
MATVRKTKSKGECQMLEIPIRESILSPVTSQKSFYGKAVVSRNPQGDVVLTSYHTPVAAMRVHPENGNIQVCRLWDSWSATSGKHINAFFLTYFGQGCGKASWEKMPVGEWLDIIPTTKKGATK